MNERIRLIVTRHRKVCVRVLIVSSILGHSQEVNEKFYTYDTSKMVYKLDVVEGINKKIAVSRKHGYF